MVSMAVVEGEEARGEGIAGVLDGNGAGVEGIANTVLDDLFCDGLGEGDS